MSPSNPPDRFTIQPDEPFAELQRDLSAFLCEAHAAHESNFKPQKLNSGQRLLALDKADQVNALFAAINRMMWLCLHERPRFPDTDEDLKELQAYERMKNALSNLIGTFAGRKLPWNEQHLGQLVDVVVTATKKDGKQTPVFDLGQTPIPGVLPLLVSELETRFSQTGVPAPFRAGLEQLEGILTHWESWAGYKKTLARLRPLLKFEKGAPLESSLPDAGEAWAEALREDIAALKPKPREAWLKLLGNVPGATLVNQPPSGRWRPKVCWRPLGGRSSRVTWRDGLALSAPGRSKGWARATDSSCARWFGIAACSTETPLPSARQCGGRGLPQASPRRVVWSSIAKASIAALESMDGLEPLAQLSRLKLRLKTPWGQEEVQKALASAVKRAGVSLDEVEEISCPTFDFAADGKLHRKIGNYTAELSIVGTHAVSLAWRDSSGKVWERDPSDLKSHAAELKSLKQLARDIEKMLVAQRERIERLFVAERTWNYATWRERYLDHPLIAHQTRRLIWQFTNGQHSESAIWFDGQLVNARGDAIDWLKPTTRVQLWHPLGVSVEGVRAWREWLERRHISQPFKQAHREIYVLTDAEIATRTYSNRFAAHILRQHQFKALCDARGWKYEFLGDWDGDHAGAARELPTAKLRAHFWLNHAGDEFSPAGVALYVGTDQVRFSDEQTSARELSEVPALIFSETMRDVDLFVSVCSLGADPAWNPDRNEPAAELPHRAYWEAFAFGELSATARTRHGVLERLLPKLTITDRCSLREKFLVVKGSLRTYKIHLGSGNILMEPNDQYLCIVPDRSTASFKTSEKVFLPFEGDSTLSVILSKAFLLAEDAKLSDETILRQIKNDAE